MLIGGTARNNGMFRAGNAATLKTGVINIMYFLFNFYFLIVFINLYAYIILIFLLMIKL